ncbi:protein phosphatase 2C domain-containing protein [Neptunomonas sp.]|uniref:PP2C family protein-serine/threonine phosphatase n=1 Tax=Neptunomonas sp. TaxID=1971898 RepID=UPI0025E29556|nr:protein phosphatase 2C domain-containing protein [Neptunomonas sp.]
MNRSKSFVWQSAGLTDTGNIRKVNEDSFLDSPDTGIWVVADGMGGHDSGDVASKSVIDSLDALPSMSEIDMFVEAAQDNLWDVNKELRLIADNRGSQTTIGSTVALLLAINGDCAVLWAGDSRVYRLRNGAIAAVTHDHSQVQEMVDKGLIKAADAESHPASNIITRAIGAYENLVVDVKFDKIHAYDRYVICSDGLYKEVSESEIEQIMQSSNNINFVASRLMELALSRGARDNVTVVAVEFSHKTKS